MLLILLAVGSESWLCPGPRDASCELAIETCGPVLYDLVIVVFCLWFT